MPTPLPIVYGPQLCGDLPTAATREWLVPDGCGGYASGTVAGLRTRRYHGLFVISGARASDRHLGLVSLDPVLHLPGASVPLACHEWASGAISPDGNRFLEHFEVVDGLPRWRWRVGDVVLERELAMGYRERTLGVVHRLLAGGPVRLTLDALCTWRDGHGERFASGGDLPTTPAADGVVVADAYRLAGPGFTPAGGWYEGVHLRAEADRGLAAHEDVWHAGSFTADLSTGQAIEVSAWGGDLAQRPRPAGELIEAAHARARAVLTTAAPVDAVGATLALAADAFVVRPPEAGAPDVVAGYPWFGAWSRDTMISYEGLLLATNRADEGRELLRGYAATVSQGMLANTADTGSVEFNTVDGTLWFAHAVGRHVTVAGDADLAAELVATLDGIVAAHLAGTRYGIRVDPTDGLLTQGQPGYALTWMDAVINGDAVTPRIGKPVEINALWINALATVAALHERLGSDATALHGHIARATASFRRRFPAPTGWLYDVVDGPAGDDAALRPNQALAYGLPYAPLRGEPLPGAVGAQLLTPLGLRSLGPAETGYVSAHRGGPVERDRGYHQGTVWPWLIGPYADARHAAGQPTAELFAGLAAHLGEGGLGSVSETADGAAPHNLSGCPFQAWSVAEVNRAPAATDDIVVAFGFTCTKSRCRTRATSSRNTGRVPPDTSYGTSVGARWRVSGGGRAGARAKERPMPQEDDRFAGRPSSLVQTAPGPTKPARSLRILMLSWEYPPVVVGGLGRHVHALATSLARAGHQVTVVTRHSPDAPLEEVREGVRVVRAPEDPPLFPLSTPTLLAWTMAFNHSLTRAALHATATDGYDVIHAHDWLVTHTAVTMKDHLGVPLVSTIHATEAGRHQGWLPDDMNKCIHSVEWWLAREANRIVVCSEYMRWEVSRLLEMESGQITVIPNGVTAPEWQATPDAIDAARARFAGEGPLVGFAGRLVYEKGVQHLISALPELRWRHPGLRMVIAGDGPHKAHLQAEVREMRLDRAVSFAGFVGPDLPSTMAATDAFVVPSIYEPFGMVALEAAAAGAPLAVAATGGLAEIVEPGVTGVTFPAKNTGALADAVSGLLADEPAAQRMAAEAKQMVHERYAWPSIAASTAAAYRATIADAPENKAQVRARRAADRPTIIVPEGNLLSLDDVLM